MKKKINRVGEINVNDQELAMQIVTYKNNKHIEVEFLATGERVWTRYDSFRQGTVKADLEKYPFKISKEAKWGCVAFIAATLVGLGFIGLGIYKLFQLL